MLIVVARDAAPTPYGAIADRTLGDVVVKLTERLASRFMSARKFDTPRPSLSVSKSSTWWVPVTTTQRSLPEACASILESANAGWDSWGHVLHKLVVT
jgi:hypothetical protein